MGNEIRINGRIAEAVLKAKPSGEDELVLVDYGILKRQIKQILADEQKQLRDAIRTLKAIDKDIQSKIPYISHQSRALAEASYDEAVKQLFKCLPESDLE